MKQYLISEWTLKQLLESALVLESLEAEGVDNWAGYEEAYASLNLPDEVDAMLDDYQVYEE